MSRKLILLFLFVLIVTGAVAAQEQERAKNVVSVQFGAIGIEGSYERMFSRRFSVLADVSYTTMIFMDEFTASAKGRWYPFSGAFYMEMGLGYSYGKGAVGMMADMMLGAMTLGLYWLIKDYDDDIFRNGGLLIQPGLGWKIDIGKPDGFVLPISLGLDIKISETPDFMPYLRLGLGYAF